METATPFQKGTKVRLMKSRTFDETGPEPMYVKRGTVGEYVGPDLRDPRFERVMFGGREWSGVHVTDLEQAE